jgi:rSAM/selenodomain-associated transferase 2
VKIAVIIPTLNEEQALPDTLQRTTALGLDDIIVVDGGSTDRTQEIACDLLVRDARCEVRGTGAETSSPRTPNPEPRTPHLRLITSAAGRARQMNTGASHSQADVLLFLHADTHLPDEARHAIERALDDPACVGGRFDVRFERDTGLAWLIARLISLRSRWSGIATGDQALFVRHEVFAQLGGFTDIPIMEDVDFTCRLKRAGHVAPLRAHVVTSYRRWDRHGALRTIVLMWALRLLYWLGVHPNRLKNLYASVR